MFIAMEIRVPLKKSNANGVLEVIEFSNENDGDGVPEKNCWEMSR